MHALMENRHRILPGFSAEIFRSVASEIAGCLAPLQGQAAARLHAHEQSLPTSTPGEKKPKPIVAVR
ncbi:MAG TPA: hypothetical protein VKE49_04565 [Myxococcaceae bacterium]|nr:hypothetical protein [Myxococcaceae bacterium]